MNLGIITDQIDLDLEKALRIIAEHGYSTIELHSVFNKPVEVLSIEEAKKAKRLIDAYGMNVSNLASTFFFMCPLYEQDIVSLFNEKFHCIEGDYNKHLDLIENACKVAQVFNCKKIRVFPFRFPDNRKPPFGTKEDMRWICDRMQQACKIASKYQCELILENCPYSHCPKGEMTYTLLKMCNCDNLKLLWDPANSYRAVKSNVETQYLNKSLIDELELIYPYIAHIHIKDYHFDDCYEKPFVHKPIYSGDIDFDELIDFLKKHGYNQTLSLEPEVSLDDTILCMKRLKEKVDH